jgi:hypothetical protein
MPCPSVACSARHHAPHNHRPPDAAPLVCTPIQSKWRTKVFFAGEVVTIRFSTGWSGQWKGRMSLCSLSRSTNKGYLSAASHTFRHSPLCESGSLHQRHEAGTQSEMLVTDALHGYFQGQIPRVSAMDFGKEVKLLNHHDQITPTLSSQPERSEVERLKR